jgi:hypothetical protein
MSRRIRTETLNAAGGVAAPGDDYTDRIVKLIPGDVVAAWLAVVSAIKAAAAPPSQTVVWAAFAVGCIVAAAWTWRKASLPNAPAVRQTVVSTLAFAVWAYAMGGPAPLWPGDIYNALTATLLLIGFSLVSGLLTNP